MKFYENKQHYPLAYRATDRAIHSKAPLVPERRFRLFECMKSEVRFK
jgi:hypothetical protein